jgi:hypothetical protein
MNYFVFTISGFQLLLNLLLSFVYIYTVVYVYCKWLLCSNSDMHCDWLVCSIIHNRCILAYIYFVWLRFLLYLFMGLSGIAAIHYLFPILAHIAIFAFLVYSYIHYRLSWLYKWFSSADIRCRVYQKGNPILACSCVLNILRVYFFQKILF